MCWYWSLSWYIRWYNICWLPKCHVFAVFAFCFFAANWGCLLMHEEFQDAFAGKPQRLGSQNIWLQGPHHTIHLHREGEQNFSTLVERQKSGMLRDPTIVWGWKREVGSSWYILILVYTWNLQIVRQYYKMLTYQAHIDKLLVKWRQQCNVM